MSYQEEKKKQDASGFTKKVDQLEKLLNELIEEADANGWSFNVGYMFQDEPSRGDISYNGSGNWSYSNC